MMKPEKGDLCKIIAGRRAGLACIISNPLDAKFVNALVPARAGDEKKLVERTFNVKHLKFLGQREELNSPVLYDRLLELSEVKSR